MPWRVPVLCAVTDRRRFGLGDGAVSLDAVVAQVREAAEADLDLVQIRELDLSASALFSLVLRALDAVRSVPSTRTRILVNDRLDVARAAGAHGVHLRSTSFAASRVRHVVGAVEGTAGAAGGTTAGFLVGRSVHAIDALDELAPRALDLALDYLVMGTMFATTSKGEGHRLAGPEGLRAMVPRVDRPVLGIGGITLENAPQIADAGAAGIAAIGLFLGRGAPAHAGPALELRRVADEIRRLFAVSRSLQPGLGSRPTER
jgi:thiamine-phosphate pyrophosphorylase